MSAKNTTTTTKNERDVYLNDELAELAYNLTVGTLKRIEAASSDPKIGQMLNGLRADRRKTGVAGLKNSTMSDGYDCFLVAYEYLLSKCTEGYKPDDILTTDLVNGGEKNRTVAQWACVAVRQYIYRHAQRHYKRAYIEILPNEDGETETEAEIIDRHYYRVGKYYDIPDLWEYEAQEEFYRGIMEHFTPRQKLILHYRRQGLGADCAADGLTQVSEIAKKLNVSQAAVSKQLSKMREIVTELHPEAVRHYKETRQKKRVAVRCKFTKIVMDYEEVNADGHIIDRWREVYTLANNRIYRTDIEHDEKPYTVALDFSNTEFSKKSILYTWSHVVDKLKDDYKRGCVFSIPYYHVIGMKCE